MAKVWSAAGRVPPSGTAAATRWCATKRRFDPNLQKVRILDGKRRARVYVCTRCLKAGKVTKAV